MKHLPKHLRPRRRYLAVGIETWPDASLDRRSFQRSLWASLRSLLGDAGSAAVACTVVQFDHDGSVGRAVVRVRRGTVEDARAAVACLTEVNGHPVGVRVRGTSGTIRGCEEKYLGGRAEQSNERTVVFRHNERDAVSRPPRIDVGDGSPFVGATAFDLD